MPRRFAKFAQLFVGHMFLSRVRNASTSKAVS